MITILATFFPIILMVVWIFLGEETNKLSQIIFIVSLILSIPLLLSEFFMLLWLWAGGGTFTQRAVPITWGIILCIQVLLMNLFSGKRYIRKAMILSMIFLTPYLTYLTVIILADIFGIVIYLY